MKVIMVNPGEYAAKVEIGNDLKDMQAAVGGYIQAIYPFDDPVAIVCNEEGKVNNMPFNRVLYNEDLEPYDVICGPFFICGLTEDNFGDIPEELVKDYLYKFYLPERIYPTGSGILTLKYHPEKEA